MKRPAVIASIAMLVFWGGLFSLSPSTVAASLPLPDRAAHPNDVLWVAHSLKELIKWSDTIVIGQISNTNTWVNLARNPNNIAEPDTRISIIGQIYRVDVERYLMGGGSNVIYFAQAEGSVTFLETQTPNAIQAARASARYKVPKSNARYMLFLRVICPLPEYLSGAIEPWRFDLSNPDAVVAESIWEGVNECFPPTPLSAFTLQVQALIPTATVTPVSPPTSKGTAFPTNSPCAGSSEPATVTLTPNPSATITAQPSR